MQSCAKEAWGEMFWVSEPVTSVTSLDIVNTCPRKPPSPPPWLRLKQPPSKPHSPPPQRPDANYGSPTPEIHEATTTTNAVFNPVNWV